LNTIQVLFVVVAAVAAVTAVAAVACLPVLYWIKQFENLPLQQGSHARMQFDILPLQQAFMHAVWYPATALQWLQQGSGVRIHAVWEPATAAGKHLVAL
jgi:hypothetical protein